MQEDQISPFLLPLSVETILLRNCSISLHKDLEKPILLTLDGRFTLDFLDQPGNNNLLSTLSGRLQVRGGLALTGEVDLQSLDSGYTVSLRMQAPDIDQFIHFFPGLQDVRLAGELALDGRIRFDRSFSENMDYEATVKSSGFRFRKNDIILATGSTEEPASLRLTGNSRKAEYTLADVVLAEPEKLALDLKGEIDLSARRFNGTGHVFFERTASGVTVNYDGDKLQSVTRLRYELTGEAFDIANNFSCSSFKAGGDITLDGPALAANLRGVIPRITVGKSDTTLINLSLQLPFHYPPPATGPTGELEIEEIRYQNIKSGRLGATFQPSPRGIAFTTLLTTPFIPGLQLSCTGSALGAADISAHCRFPETAVDSTQFPDGMPLPDKLSFNGRLAATGEFQVKDKVPAGKLTVDFRHGTLTQNENKLSDINLTVVYPRLPLLQSSPGQLATIGSLEFGKIKLSDARIHFRLEDEQSIFLEKIRATWCGGKVETGSFTLAGDMKELETTLYCDRLGFTELLAQLGLDKTEGQGSLNGRLPIIINKQGVIFDDGFLFSTPGNSGIVRFNDTRQLLQGMPDMGGSAYLDYSMKALENFSYNWTKLFFNSQQDDLLIAMQLDGKPAAPLPFGYKDGQIVPSGEGSGLQHPIRLDVNFRLPMRDLFQYGKNIQSFMENR
jgi:hypothetical protein